MENLRKSKSRSIENTNLEDQFKTNTRSSVDQKLWNLKSQDFFENGVDEKLLMRWSTLMKNSTRFEIVCLMKIEEELKKKQEETSY